jgi:hypothetical protein
LNGRRRGLQEALAVAFARSARAVEPAPGTETMAVPVGDGRVHLAVRRFGNGGLRYLSLHENEHTAVEAAVAVLAHQAGTLIELRGSGRRLVSFRDGVRPLAFDPNRIFTDAGIRQTLCRHGSYTGAGIAAARRLRDAVLVLLDGRPNDPVVALHSNAGGLYSIQAYRPGGAHAGDVEALAVHSDRAPDAFFLVTRASLFESLRDAGFNVVLQNDHPADDGSLSLWFQLQGRAYINVEARLGAVQEQQRMLEAVTALAQW